jgi:hypothetical protein
MRKTKLARKLEKVHGPLVDDGHGGLRRKFRKRVRVTHAPLTPKLVYKECPVCHLSGRMNCSCGGICRKCNWSGKLPCTKCDGVGRVLVPQSAGKARRR